MCGTGRTGAAYRDRGAPVDAAGEPVHAACVADVPSRVSCVEEGGRGRGGDSQIHHPQPAPVHAKVRRRHQPDHRAEKHAVAAHDGDEHGRRVDEAPRVHGGAQQRSHVCAAADRQAARQQRGDVEPAAHGIPADVDPQLGGDERGAREEHDAARRGRRRAVLQEHQQLREVPDGRETREAVLRRRRHHDPRHAAEDVRQRRGHDLSEEGVLRRLAEPRVVAVVEDAGRDGAHRRDRALHDRPAHRVDRGGRRERQPGGGHGRERPDEERDEEDDGQRGGDHQEAVEAVRVDPDQRERDDVEDDVADSAGGGGGG